MASLVHDDILDGAQKRRNKITAYAKWGSEIAVLLGDSLFSHALVLCTRLSNQEASRKIAEAAHEVCNGEIIQTQRRFDLNFSIEDYYRVIRMKTAALFRISTELAGVISGASETKINALRQYGESLGIAYQIYDDCLDLIGVEDSTGKTLGTDLGKGKLTLPVLHVLKQLQGDELHQVREIILHGTPEDRKQLIGLVLDRGGLHHAIRQTQEEIKRGIESLNVLPENDARKALQRIPEALSEHLKGISI
jgi:octaprenyl-diphosphate synthase